MKGLSEWKRKPLSLKELEKLQCPNGSFTCGLLQKLKTGRLCNSCRKSLGCDSEKEKGQSDKA